MGARKVIISCAVTGSIHTPSMSPYLPVTAHEIAQSALAAAEAAVGGREIRRAAGGELMRTGRGKNRPSRYCGWGEGDGPTRLTLYPT